MTNSRLSTTLVDQKYLWKGKLMKQFMSIVTSATTAFALFGMIHFWKFTSVEVTTSKRHFNV